MEIKLSLVIPVFNAEPFILHTLERLSEWKRGLDYQSQVILVNDGSRDRTAQIIKNFIQTRDPGIEFLSYPQNQGKGFAVKSGMLAAQGQYRVFTDADIPFGFEAIDRILNYLDFKEFDVCIGNRKSVHSSYYVKMSWPRKLASLIFTLFISRYVVTGINDTQCGLKGFRAEVADRLFREQRIKGFAFDVELLYYSYKHEYDIKRMPVVFEGNNFSTINLTRASMQMLWDIFLLPFRYHFSKKK